MIGGNAITLGSGGSITNNSSNLQTLNLNLSLPGAGTVTTNGSGGNVTLGGALSGAGSLTKAGAGLLTLSGSNVLGAYTLNSGSIRNTGWMEVASGDSGIFVMSGTLENTGRIAQRVQIQLNGANAGLINSGTVSQGSYGPAYIANGASVTNSGQWFSAGLAIGAGAADNTYQLTTFTNNAGGSLTINTNVNIGRSSNATTVAGTSALVLTGGTVTSSGTLNLNITGTTMSNVTAAVDLNGGVLATSKPIISTLSKQKDFISVSKSVWAVAAPVDERSTMSHLHFE